ncbi:MAG: hypothetical protein K5643_01295, partial [Saccharofermentans sp.]|nr:hypothetical protein [Saccharofermentans sp.]
MNMKSVKWGILAVVTVLAGAFVLLPAKTVNADDNLEIKIDQTVQVNFSGSKDRFVKYVATQDKMVNLSSEGYYFVEASVYKDNTEDSSLITDEYVEDGENFSLTWYLPKGTYYFKVSRTNNQANGYTKVTLKDVTDTAVVVNVNETNFPDEAFRSYVDENIDLR